jgi:glycosyltransferase involved in cell wall biosynthesis
MAEKRTSILIGIPSFRRPEGLRKLLDSIASQQGMDNLEIAVFVADNDPQDHQAHDIVKELAPSFRWPLACRIVQDPGIAAARNAILSQARGRGVDFIAMIDDDEVAEPAWLSELLACQSRYDADVVGGPVDFNFEEEPSASIRRCGIFDVPSWDDGIVPLLYASGNLLLTADILERGNWPQFDLSFGLTGGEDGEFLRRMRRNGARFAWSTRAIVRERVPRNRANPDWVLLRSFRKGNINMRIEQFHGGRIGAAVSLAKAIVWLGSAPVGALLLTAPSRRLWILGKWSQSIGKFAALFGRYSRGYGAYPANGSS